MNSSGLKHMIHAQAPRVKDVSNPPNPPFSKGGRNSGNVSPLFLKGGRGGFNKGFTLVEVIATIIATAIVSVIFINFMGTAMSKSAQAVEMVRGEASAEATLERIVSDYVLKMNQDNATALGLIKTDIDNKTVYGKDVTAAYVIFDSNGNQISDTAGLNRTLKVTIAASGNDLTTLLTRSRSANSPPVAF